MKKKTIYSALIAMSLTILTTTGLAAPSPQEVIKDGAEEVRKILTKKTKKGSPAEKVQKEKLKKVVDGFLDYQELSRRSLGPHWKDRSEEEKTEFTKLLRDLIEASYTSTISDNIEFSMEYEEEEIDEDTMTATVASVASAKNKKGKTVSEDLTFHLYLKKRIWLMYDVEFGDVSLVRHYRGEFNRKIKKESYKALLTAMQKKLKEIESGKVKVEKKPKL
ncbi:MAG: ABC transporter substrate-binding protein [Deltaproteobacteria bacterium]|nr:ABC transporter substrate-binding protein [Deltaproteobacteria bacterium]